MKHANEKNDATELVFLLDRSGSMAGLEQDTIGGFNAMIRKQKEKEGACLVSTVLFDTECSVLHDRVPLEKVEPLTERDYSVGGCTALLDAVGGAIRHIASIHKYARPEDVPAHTVFAITTDGMENASHLYRRDEVRRMISHEREKYDWEFLFLAANIDAEETAEAIGISRELALNYTADKKETARLFRRIDRTVGAARACAPAEEFKAALRDDIE
jgi:uncharacterized protein YegL